MRTFYAICLVALALAAQPAQAQVYSTYYYPQPRVYYGWPTYYAAPTYYQSPYVYQSYYSAPSYYVAPTVVTQPTVVAPARVVAPPVVARSYYYTPDTPSTVSISIFHNVFSTSATSIQAGTTVRWVNRSERVHTITSSDGRWSSGDILPGATFEAVFHHPGTYNYHCRHHPGMVGMIVVEN